MILIETNIANGVVTLNISLTVFAVNDKRNIKVATMKALLCATLCGKEKSEKEILLSAYRHQKSASKVTRKEESTIAVKSISLAQDLRNRVTPSFQA